MPHTTRRTAIVVILILAALVFAACGGSPAPTATPVPPTVTPVPPTDTPVPPTDTPAPAPAEEEAVATEPPAEEAAEDAAATPEATEEAAEEAAATLEATEEAAEEAAEAAAEATPAPTEEPAAEATPAATEEPAEEAMPAPAEKSAEAAAMAGIVTVESARLVTNVINEREAPFAAISPDGSRIAWFNQTGRRSDRTGVLCVFTFANADKTCYPIARDVFRDWPYQLQWSPDSSMIAFTENPVDLGNDADIWLFTVADGVFQNLTDDGVVGSWRQAGNATIDYLPSWNPVDGSIVFWRVKPMGFMDFDVALYKVAPGGEAELVRDLTEYLSARVLVFNQERFFLDGFSAVSPDGAKVAALVSAFNEFGALRPDLWVIDLNDADAEPMLVMSFDDYQSAIPDWTGIPASPSGLSWTADGAGIVSVAVSDMGNSTPFTVFFYSDLASGESTPVVDFSDVEDSMMYFDNAPGSTLPWRAYSPWTGSLSPSGAKLLMLNDLTGRMALFTSPLPPTGDLPGVAESAEESTASRVTRSSRADNGLMLMYGLLLTVVEE
ncbi:MAG: TolB family protein [Caldilinea sp.]